MKAKSKKKFVYVCGVEHQHELGSKGGSGPYEVFNSVDDLKTYASCWPQCGIVKVELKNVKWVVPQDLTKIDSSQPISKKRRKAIAFERKLRDYRHFLKHDEDYDWQFVVRLLRFKLERTRKCILDNKIIKGAPKVGKEIREVVNLLKRVEDDRYFEELHRPFWKKYGKPKMIFGKADARGLTPVTVKYPKETSRNQKRLVRESVRLGYEEQRLRQADLKKAFRLMEKNLWNWWD